MATRFMSNARPRKSFAKAKYHLRAAKYHSRKTSFSKPKFKRRKSFGRRKRY